MGKRLVSQIDKRWKLISRYDMHSVDALHALDDSILKVLNVPTIRNKKSATNALIRFTQTIEKLIERGDVLNGIRTYPIYQYGCWDYCLCMVAYDFKQKLYECRKREWLVPTPPNFLKVLRSWQMLSVIGYQFDIVLDVMSIITRGKVQLVMQEDYGIRGVSISNSPLLRFALVHRKYLTIVACVEDHAVFGKAPSTHWVVIDPLGPELSDGLMMRDPNCTHSKRFRYRRLYILSLYSTRKQAQKLLADRI